MKTRWIFQSRISNTSHHRPAPHSGTPARHAPSWCSPWLVPSHTTISTLLGMETCLPRLRGSSYCHAGMTPEQIAQVRPRLVEFTAGMLGGLARSDQRAAGELYVRGLLTDGRRKSMQPMAARLGVDHQRLQQ